MKYNLILLFLFTTSCSFSQSTEYFKENGIAIESYDVVSYFKGKAVKGNDSFVVIYDKVEWRFSNAENLKEFKANPKSFIPQYGGWCAYAMAVDGSKVKVDPETYKIINDKLYLFYNFNFTNTLKSWNKNESEYLQKADSFWQIQKSSH